ncbi:MAG: hypothetical protein HY999_00705 [Nitrospinae bacterium]|nr:hypothetical protein [Nitrospinota bacterium]
MSIKKWRKNGDFFKKITKYKVWYTKGKKTTTGGYPRRGSKIINRKRGEAFLG